MQGNQAGEHSAVGNLHAPAVKVLGQLPVKPQGDGGAVAGVGDDKEFVGGQAVADGVVNDAALFVADEAVAGAPYPQG